MDQRLVTNEKLTEDSTMRITAMQKLREKYGMKIEDSELKETAERVEIVNLAKEPRFSEYYLGAMYLEEWENRL